MYITPFASYQIHITYTSSFHAEHWKLKTKRTPRELSPTENCIGLNSVRVQQRPKSGRGGGWGRTTVRWKCNAIPATHPIQRKRLASRPSRCSTRITHQKAKSAAWLDTHTHIHLLKQVAWFLVKQVTPGLKEPTSDLLVQVNCATRTSRFSAKGPNESLYCWWTHKPRQCCQVEITSLPIKPKSCHYWWSKSCISNHATCWPINIQVTSLVDPSRHLLTHQIPSRLFNKSRPHYWTRSRLAFLWQTDVRPWWSASSHLYPLTCLSAQPHRLSPSYSQQSTLR